MRSLFAVLLTLLFCLSVASAQDPTIPSGLCGDGVLDPGEACDPGQPDYGVDPDLGDATCEGQGFNGGGEVSCTSKCTLDISACYCDVGTKFPATGWTTCWGIVDGFLRQVDCANTGQDGEVRAGAPMSYTDNGDGTITDNNTGLMWEKKNNSGGIHDAGARYSWSESLTDFIDPLNDTCDGDGLTLCEADDDCGAGGVCGFAGYRDWRMPNVKELQGIVDYGIGIPAVNPAFRSSCISGCIDCSCTVLGPYWSSSPHPYNRFDAWYVDFTRGTVFRISVDFPGYVRAVRGGLD